ncbi:NUDIX domain [Rhizoctonia solani]|uniref:NUDIX domain n=1 Tax=Rhizoctonia solani TaxID=456999 RepID=A0A8H7IBV4_9AGAM|nr:NUDIX domain [Rhizoctonia solani]
MGRADVARPRTVCCAIPIARAAGKVLLITSRKRPHQWVLPKGGWETTDPTLEAAACREAFEEAGVQGKITRAVTSIPGPTAHYHFFELDVAGLADQWDEAASADENGGAQNVLSGSLVKKIAGGTRVDTDMFAELHQNRFALVLIGLCATPLQC